jgi:hypothetical protein
VGQGDHLPYPDSRTLRTAQNGPEAFAASREPAEGETPTSRREGGVTVAEGVEYVLLADPVVTDVGVRHWRRGEFLRLGIPWDYANALAYRVEADVHKVEDMLTNGATADQVFRILGGTDITTRGSDARPG